MRTVKGKGKILEVMAVGEFTDCGWECIEVTREDRFNSDRQKTWEVAWMRLRKGNKTYTWVVEAKCECRGTNG